MARTRYIKPSFFTNDELAELKPLARILFAGLWCISDREGRLEDRPKKIKAEVLPFDNCNIDSLLQSLHDAGFIQRFVSGDRRFIQVVNFLRHQTPHVKEVPSIIPAPDSSESGLIPAPPVPYTELKQNSNGEQVPEQNGGLLAVLATHYSQECSALITPLVQQELTEWADVIPDASFVEYAFKESSGMRNWKYTKSIFERLQREGWPRENGTANGGTEDFDKRARQRAEEYIAWTNGS